MKVEKQIELLRDAEGVFLSLDAHKKVLAAQLYLSAEGKNVAEKEAVVYASSEWTAFAKAHAEAESNLNHEKRRYELKLKAYDAEHLSFKNEAPAIRRQST